MAKANAVSSTPKLEQYWTVHQVAERLNAGESSVRKWMGEGRLKRKKIGDLTRITESDLQQFIKECTEVKRTCRKS